MEATPSGEAATEDDGAGFDVDVVAQRATRNQGSVLPECTSVSSS